jgi:hypothetical protein
MKKFGIVLIALAAVLVLPGSAKADSFSYTGGTGSLFGLGAPWIGSGTFSGSSLGPGSQSFSFETFFNLGGGFSSITIGSGHPRSMGYSRAASPIPVVVARSVRSGQQT